jgi:hypothetical protein
VTVNLSYQGLVTGIEANGQRRSANAVADQWLLSIDLAGGFPSPAYATTASW